MNVPRPPPFDPPDAQSSFTLVALACSVVALPAESPAVSVTLVPTVTLVALACSVVALPAELTVTRLVPVEVVYESEPTESGV